MSASDSVRASLESIGFVQLVLLFAALIAYGVALGQAFPGRLRSAAAATALVAAAGFAAAAPALADGVVLLALAVALVGLFSGGAWLIAGLLHLDSPARAPIAEAAPGSPLARTVDTMLTPARAAARAP